jgi:L-lactate dehydrogenase complex protein LldF
MAWKFWKNAMLSRTLMNTGSGSVKSWVVRHFVKGWKEHRSELVFPARSFNQLWKERNKEK